MAKLTKYEQDILDRLTELIHEGKLSDTFMVESLKLLADYSNLSRVKDYAARHNITPQGVMKCRNTFSLAGYHVITDPN